VTTHGNALYLFLAVLPSRKTTIQLLTPKAFASLSLSYPSWLYRRFYSARRRTSFC
jgi:hypothetical protein